MCINHGRGDFYNNLMIADFENICALVTIITNVNLRHVIPIFSVTASCDIGRSRPVGKNISYL